MEGTCNCGAITVKVKDDELFSRPRGHICRCINCRKTSGSVMASNLMIENEKIEVTGRDNLKVYSDPKTSSGKPVERHFCSTCGNPIMSVTPNAPGKSILKLGIFDKVPTPEWESFGVHRQEWETPIEGTTQFKKLTGGEKM